MNLTRSLAGRPAAPFRAIAMAILTLAAGSVMAQDKGMTYEGRPARIGQGSAHTVVRTDASGQPVSIGVVFTEGMLKGLPKAAKRKNPDFPYQLTMPTRGPKTVVNHVVINWESTGHPPPKVYDTPHFDFHFYMIDRAQQTGIQFKSELQSGDPDQQPPAELLPVGYIVPPGTAVPAMGVHAINPAAPEFNGQPFTATFIYGYHDRQLTFLEPMTSLAFLASKPNFAAPVARPAKYSKAGAYPASYGVHYDAARKTYEVSLGEFQ